MQNLSERSQVEPKRPAGPGPLGQAFVALLPVLACFLGGATQKWSEGIVLTLLGFYLLIRPPRYSLGLGMNLALVAFVIAGAIAFLPASSFSEPSWRSAFVNDLGIQLPNTVSPQPWITLTQLFSLVAGVAWLYVVCTQDIELREARFELRLFTAGIAMLAAISVLFYLAHSSVPFWHNARNFGPFPNRNQTANLFGLSAIIILACGQDDIRKGRKRWIVWLFALVAVVVAVILDFSRAGIGLLIGGSALWLGIFALRQRSASRLALGVSVLLLLLTAMLLFGGKTFERFHLHDSAGAAISADFRWRIFQDAFALIREAPWCGLGLGNFESVFATFRNASINDQRALHPESDWLWLWSEMGWIGVVLAIVGLILIIRSVFPLREGTNQRYRLATLIAACLFALHGLIDVSGHRVGTIFAAIFLLGLSLHRPLSWKPSGGMPILFRLIGIILILAGGSWVIGTRGQKLVPGSLGVTNAKRQATIANRGRDYSETIRLTSQALTWAPLDWELYFSRALAEVETKQTDAALADFRRSRFLEPLSYELPLAEGTAWLKSQPLLAATAWREALRRAGSQRAGVFAVMLNTSATRSPALKSILEEMGVHHRDLALPYLSATFGSSFNHALFEILKSDPNLATFNETEKLALFALWSERGDAEELSRAVAQHPDWLTYAWFGVAKYDANKNDFRAAYELTQRYGEPVALPRISSNASLLELESRFRNAPDNYGIGYELYRAQKQSGRIDDALETVRHFSERPNSPAYFRYLEAECWAEKGNWERAWKAWQAFHSSESGAGK